MWEEMDGKLYISCQSRHFSFIVNVIKVLFPFCTLIWRVNNYVSRQGKGINRESKVLVFWLFVLLKRFSLLLNSFECPWLEEITRNSQSQNTFAPGITEEYNTQVSEETESRFTKELSQVFSRTESRLLGALSKLDEFLLNPQLRTFSGTVPRTFQNNDLKHRKPTGDRSQNDRYPGVEFSTLRTSNSADSDQEEYSHSKWYFVELYFARCSSAKNVFRQHDCYLMRPTHAEFREQTFQLPTLRSLIQLRKILQLHRNFYSFSSSFCSISLTCFVQVY